MTDTNELEAAPSPIAGWGGLFSLVGSVVALVPRWLVVAAGVVAVVFMGTEAYLKIRAQMAATQQAEAQSAIEAERMKGATAPARRIPPSENPLFGK